MVHRERHSGLFTVASTAVTSAQSTMPEAIAVCHGCGILRSVSRFLPQRPRYDVSCACAQAKELLWHGRGTSTPRGEEVR